MGLELNVQKTKCKVFKGQHARPFRLQANGILLYKVPTIDYLGIRINEQLKWDAQITKGTLIIRQRAGGVSRLHASTNTRAITSAIEAYKLQGQAASIYGV